jgi:hypothetical protein
MMKLFSERMGLKRGRTQFQVDKVDYELRSRLWNKFISIYWSELLRDYRTFREFAEKLWDNYFKRPIDTIPEDPHKCREEIRKYFFNCKWFEVYDLLEFIVENSPVIFLVNSPNMQSLVDVFKSECNKILKEELSAYRFVGNQITKITAKEEIDEIENALRNPLKNVRQHIENALKLLSDRKNPDYRNSIKESISAVEAVCKLITKNENATLGEALDIIKKRGDIEIHPSLLEAFKKLYGYTSSADGIRHALTEEKVNVGFDEAKFMLVVCSAFVNYLTSKSKNII